MAGVVFFQIVNGYHYESRIEAIVRVIFEAMAREPSSLCSWKSSCWGAIYSLDVAIC